MTMCVAKAAPRLSNFPAASRPSTRDHRLRSRRAGARHPLCHDQHQRQAHRPRRSLPGGAHRYPPGFLLPFDGFESETYRIIRGEPDILDEKLRALDRLAQIGLNVTIVPAIERGVNEHEIGKIIEFAINHPAIRGVTFQPAFHAGRYMPHDPMRRMTIPDIVRLIETQTGGKFVASDFVPVPCCFPTCNCRHLRLCRRRPGHPASANHQRE